MLLWQLRGILEGQDGRVDAMAKPMGYMPAKRADCLTSILEIDSCWLFVYISGVTIPRGQCVCNYSNQMMNE